MASTPLLLQCLPVIDEPNMPSDNLFERLIRNPRPDSLNPKERECTEMLCAVLNNAPSVRQRILMWMAGLTGMDTSVLKNLRWRIETEYSTTGGKRVDLRIEGWAGEKENEHRVILWAVEVKVGSGFHVSSACEGDDDERSRAVLVNQLANYDVWLSKQAAKHCCGFVLALASLTESLPDGLTCQWKCISWTTLGLQVQAALDAGTPPLGEEVLARHLWGFIRQHLWKGSEMPNAKLEFDDIALMRAVHAAGEDCVAKVKELCGGLEALLKSSDVGVGAVHPQLKMDMVSGKQWSLVYRNLLPISDSPTIEVGIADGDAVVFIEAHVGDEAMKGRLLNALAALLPKLTRRNPAWTVPSVDEPESYWNVELTMPLTALLTAPDQKAELERFIKAGLADLVQTGIVRAFSEVLGRSSKSKAKKKRK